MFIPGAKDRWVRAAPTPGSQTEPGLIVYRFGADLFYANADRFSDEVRALIEKAPTLVRWFILDADAVTDIDYTAARTVRDLHAELAARNVRLAFARVSEFLRTDLDNFGISVMLGEALIFDTLHEAIAASRADGGRNDPEGPKAPTPQ
jgi:MFS superfamily sulfate permease-like transporter